MKHTLYIAGICLLMLSGCAAPQEEVTSEPAGSAFRLNEQLKASTEIAEITQTPVKEQLTLSGKIEYNENDMVAYRSLIDGIIEQVRFELGDYVRKGQVLATIKSNQISELDQQQKIYQNQINLLQQKLQQKKELLQDGMIASSEVLETEHELQGARIELDKIRQSLQIYSAAGNGSFHILAPKNGYIIQKSMSAGQTIGTQEAAPLFSISNLKQVWVMVNIYANNLRYIQEGNEVKVRTIAYPDQYYSGKIDKIYNVFDDNEHVLKARVVLENNNLHLHPGLAADIIIDKNTQGRLAYAIPNQAVIFSNNRQFIVLYKNDGHMEICRIAPVARNEQYTYITEGITSDDKVVKTNALLIFEALNK